MEPFNQFAAVIWNGENNEFLLDKYGQGMIINKTSNQNDIFQGGYAFEGRNPDGYHNPVIYFYGSDMYRMNLSIYDSVIMWVKSNDSGANFSLMIGATWGCSGTRNININKYLEDGKFDTTNYKEVVIPFSDLFVDECAHQKGFEAIYFTDNTNRKSKIYFDDFWVVDSTSAFSPPSLSPKLSEENQYIEGEKAEYGIETKIPPTVFDNIIISIKKFTGFIVKFFE